MSSIVLTPEEASCQRRGASYHKGSLLRKNVKYSWRKKREPPQGHLDNDNFFVLPEPCRIFGVRLDHPDHHDDFQTASLISMTIFSLKKFDYEQWLPFHRGHNRFSTDFLFTNYWDAWRYFNLVTKDCNQEGAVP